MDDDFNKYAALPGIATASLVVINPYLENLLVPQFHYKFLESFLLSSSYLSFHLMLNVFWRL